jgi:hypothetical protein
MACLVMFVCLCRLQQITIAADRKSTSSDRPRRNQYIAKQRIFQEFEYD